MAINLKSQKYLLAVLLEAVKHILLKISFKSVQNSSCNYSTFEDYTNAHKGVLVYNLEPFTTEKLNEFIKNYVKPLSYAGKIDAFFIDEADLIIPKSIMALQQYYSIYDLFINHRHWNKIKNNGIALGMVTRRPQEMSTVFIEQSHHLFIFSLEGKNTTEHLTAIHNDFKHLIPKLKYKSYNYIHKEIGYPPKLYGKIN